MTNPPPLAGSLARALAASHAAMAAGALLQMAFVAILARLLGQAEYGLFAAAAGIMRFLTYAADLGIGTLVARRGRTLGADTLAALFLAGLAATLALAGATWVVAPWLCAWAGADAATGPSILRALGFLPAIAASGQIATALLRHDLRFDMLALQSLSALLVAQALVAIPMALAGAGARSLVASAVAQAAVASLIAWGAAPHAWRFARVPGAAILSESAWFWVLRVLDSAGFHALAPLALAFAGAAQAGIWDRAVAISILPMELIAVASAQVLFPAYARAQGDLETIRQRWRVGLAAILTVHGTIASLALVAGPELVRLALGQHWTDAAACFSILAVWGLLRGASVANGSVSEAQGALRMRASLQSGFLLVGGIALFWIAPASAAELALIVVAVDLPFQAAALVVASSATQSRFGAVIRTVLGAVTAVALASAIVVAGAQLGGVWGGLLGAGLGLGAALWWHPFAPLRAIVRQTVAGQASVG